MGGQGWGGVHTVLLRGAMLGGAGSGGRCPPGPAPPRPYSCPFERGAAPAPTPTTSADPDHQCRPPTWRPLPQPDHCWLVVRVSREVR